MKMISGIGFILFILVFYAAGAAMVGYGVYSMRASKVASAWPTVDGTLTYCDVKESRDSDGSTYVTEVKYTYVVADRRHEGRRVAFGYASSSRRHTHQEIADRLVQAKSILVRYDPQDASRSVLAYGISMSTWVFLVFGVTWLLFLTGLIVLWQMMSQSDAGILSTLVTTK